MMVVLFIFIIFNCPYLSTIPIQEVLPQFSCHKWQMVVVPEVRCQSQLPTKPMIGLRSGQNRMRKKGGQNRGTPEPVQDRQI